MTREKIMVDLLMKLNDLEKEELLLINHVADSCRVYQGVKKAINENSVGQLQNLVAS